jgi:hypothetical protein
MSAITTTLFAVVSILGIWTAASVLAAPLLVVCLRSQARVNAQCTREARRRAWNAARGA